MATKFDWITCSRVAVGCSVLANGVCAFWTQPTSITEVSIGLIGGFFGACVINRTLFPEHYQTEKKNVEAS